jgi:DcaP outer membrane protein
MTRAQRLGGLAIGGLTAIVALQTGLPAARADELADLRANQQLLEARINQLAQAQAQAPPLPGTAGGGATQGLGYKAAPSAPSLGGSFPRSFLIPGTDTSIRVGGFVDFTSLYFFNGGGNVNGSNYGSNSGQNGNLESLPTAGGFVPGRGFVPASTNFSPSRNNGINEFSPQQSRIDIETRTPTSWGEARTFLAFDWAGCDNFSCQTLGQGGGNNLLPRLRFAYGTLGGFLAGQALSNFSDADADTESLEFGGTMGSTGGQRIPQVRYTMAGPYGSAFSFSAENPWTTVVTPGGVQSSDWNQDGATGTTGSPIGQSATGLICNGIPCVGVSGTTSIATAASGSIAVANPTVTKAPSLTAASYWAQPWGHVDFAGLTRFYWLEDGRYFSHKFTGVGGHVSGDVHPNWFGLSPKDDFLWSFVVGNAIGNYVSGGEKTLYPLATNFTVTTACATPTPTCTGQFAASNLLVQPIFGFSAQIGYQHWWLPNLRSTFALGVAQQDVPSQLVGPFQTPSLNKQLFNTFVNLVWNPVAFVTTGFEYMYGHRTVVAGFSGHEHVGIYKFRVAF